MLDNSPYTVTFEYRVATHYLQAEHQFCSYVRVYVSKTAEESVLTQKNWIQLHSDTINEIIITQFTSKF